MPLRIYDTLTNAMVDFTPADPAHITFYSCGPTVYDDAHIGNFRSFLAADIMRRWLESPLCEVRNPDNSIHQGPRTVRQVMNITDVGHMTEDDLADGGGEDKMKAAGRRLIEAKKAGKHHEGENIAPAAPFAIARFSEQRFKEDARKLGLKVALDAQSDPTVMPRATDNVQGMIEMIQTLVNNGHAYAVGEKNNQTVYFDVLSFNDYGKLSGNTLENVREGAGGRLNQSDQSGKKHAADFLLWKTDPTHLMKWQSPWGTGYPGWHIECSVMALDALAPTEPRDIDLHSGGEDNIFPHHECEIAQSRCATGAQRFSRHWFHARFLVIEGEKMSKSKGNFYTPRDLFAKGHEPAAVRLELIRTHYRTNANFTDQGLKDAARQINRWRRFLKQANPSQSADPKTTDQQLDQTLTDHPVAREFAAAMHDDLNIAGAIGVINKWINTVDKPTQRDAALLTTFDQVIGLLSLERAAATSSAIGLFAPGVEPTDEIAALLEKRAAARAAKDFQTSDAIRDQLAKQGYAIKDVKDGKVEVSRA